VWLSLARNLTVIPSCKTYKVSHRSITMLIPRPFSALTVGLLASFVITSAPSGSTMVFVIHACTICSAFIVPTVRLVERVPA